MLSLLEYYFVLVDEFLHLRLDVGYFACCCVCALGGEHWVTQDPNVGYGLPI